MKNTYHSKEEAISLYNRKNICIQNSTNKNKFVGVKCMMGKTLDPILQRNKELLYTQKNISNHETNIDNSV